MCLELRACRETGGHNSVPRGGKVAGSRMHLHLHDPRAVLPSTLTHSHIHSPYTPPPSPGKQRVLFWG